MTLREVERTTGISNGYLSQLESDRVQQPSPRHLYTLAGTLKLDYVGLMRLVGYATTTDQLAAKSRAAELPGLDELAKEDRQKVIAYIQDLRNARLARERLDGAKSPRRG